MAAISVKKSEAEIYTIRNGSEWGQICLVINGETVDVLSNSTFGAYSFFWGACGTCPKKFLAKIDMHYAMNKFTNGKLMIPNPEKYECEIKRDVIRARRNGDLSAGDAREAWTELLGILEDYPAGDALYAGLVASEWFGPVFGEYEYLPNAEMVDPQCQGFWNIIWKPFIEEIKKEIGDGPSYRAPTKED